jgi:hypothetical protein
MFGQDPEKYKTFKKHYLEEHKDKKELIKQLKILEKFNHTLTLVYTSKDQNHNNAVVLLELLKKPNKTGCHGYFKNPWIKMFEQKKFYNYISNGNII